MKAIRGPYERFCTGILAFVIGWILVVLTKLVPTWVWIVIDLPFSWWKDR